MTQRFGKELKQQREQHGIALEAMAAETRLQLRHLEALEEENYGVLPGGVFRRGTVRAYLRCLGMDETQWMSRFEESFAAYAATHQIVTDDGPARWQEFAENVKRSRGSAGTSHSLRWVGLVILLLLVLGAAAYTWLILLHGQLPLRVQR